MASPALVGVAIEGSSFWINRTRGGCGVTLGAGDLVLRQRSCGCPGVVQERKSRIEEYRERRERSRTGRRFGCPDEVGGCQSRTCTVGGPSQSLTDSAMVIR